MRLLFCILAVLATATACRKTEAPPRVVVLGFDGAGWETIDPLIEAGELPFLERLRRESAWGPLETFKPTKSPVIWTSIATGKSMAKHGILDFVFLRENDLPTPYENSERREPSIWQILDHLRKRSVVVNWFVTYPPDRIEGVMVSNRFRRMLLLGPERRAGMRDSVHPEAVFDDLVPFLDIQDRKAREERNLPDLPSLYEALHHDGSLDAEPVLKDYGVYIQQEVLIENVARYLYRKERFDFFAAYFRLPDIVQRVAMRLLEPELVEQTLAAMREGRLSPEEEKRFRRKIAEVLLPFYRYMERIIEDYVAAPGNESTYFLILSDHGFSLHAGGYDHYHVPEDAPPPSGIFLMKGPKTKPGRTSTVSVYDVAPTILYLFDLPAGSDMDGKAATELLDMDRAIRYRRYSRELMTPVTRNQDQELDQEIEERTLKELRSLGYIP